MTYEPYGIVFHRGNVLLATVALAPINIADAIAPKSLQYYGSYIAAHLVGSGIACVAKRYMRQPALYVLAPCALANGLLIEWSIADEGTESPFILCSACVIFGMQNALTICGELGHTTTMMTVNSHRLIHLVVKIVTTERGIDKAERQAVSMIIASIMGFVVGAALCAMLWTHSDITDTVQTRVQCPSLFYAIPQMILFLLHDFVLLHPDLVTDSECHDHDNVQAAPTGRLTGYALIRHAQY